MLAVGNVPWCFLFIFPLAVIIAFSVGLLLQLFTSTLRPVKLVVSVK